MIYAIAGITKTVIKYQQKNNYVFHRDIISVRTKDPFYKMTDEDTLVLLPGWWGRSWAKEMVKDILAEYPQMPILYLDGKFGENERKTLESDTIHDRFEILDL